MTDHAADPNSGPSGGVFDETIGEHRSLWYDVWLQFRTHRGAMAGVIVFVLIVLAVIFGPYIHTIDPQFLNPRNANQAPSLAHPFGTRGAIV